tara:strand:+ start:53 stop:1150 length:1098 start_codon:yes stop_codon:yes gene_type:complete
MVSAGYSQSVRWGDETTYGSAAIANKDLGAVQSISPGERNNLIKVRTLGGSRDFKTVIPGKFEISGSMEYLLQGGAFLRQAWGEDTGVSTTDGGPTVLSAGGAIYRHVMGSADSPGVNDFPSFTLEFTDYEGDNHASNLQRTYSGCRVNSLTISGTVDEPVKVAVDWLAKRVQIGTADKTAATEYALDPFIFYDGNVYLTSGVIAATTTDDALNADRLARCLSFDFTLNNNLEAGWYISGTTSATDSARSAKFIIPKGRDYELRLGLHYETKELFERFLGAVGSTTDIQSVDKFQVALDMVKSGLGPGGTAAAGDHNFRLVVASATFDDMSINGAPEDIVNNDVTVFGKSVKCFFTDNVSSYKHA